MSEIEKIKEVTDEEWEQVHEFNRMLVDEFTNQGHLSPKTKEGYRSSLRIFFRWVKENCMNKPLYELKPRDALKYQNFLMARNLSSSAVKFKRSSVSSLCGYLELYYADEYPLFRNIYSKQIPNPPKAPRREKKPLTPEEYELLCKTLEEREEWQMLAYVKLSYATACRRAEALQILKEITSYNKVKDKDGNEKPYYLTHMIRCKGKGKEGKQRKLFFDDIALEAVVKWLEVRGEDDCPYIFVKKTVDGKVNQLHETSFNYWCQEIFSKIVGRRVHPHMIRSTRATHINVYEGKKIETAQKLLGHESSETTKIYVVKDGDDDVDDAF